MYYRIGKVRACYFISFAIRFCLYLNTDRIFCCYYRGRDLRVTAVHGQGIDTRVAAPLETNTAATTDGDDAVAAVPATPTTGITAAMAPARNAADATPRIGRNPRTSTLTGAGAALPTGLTCGRTHRAMPAAASPGSMGVREVRARLAPA